MLLCAWQEDGEKNRLRDDTGRRGRDRMFNKTLVPQSVAREIQGMIQSGQLKPGEKIPSQREFSQKFGISRASLREALLTLETLDC